MPFPNRASGESKWDGMSTANAEDNKSQHSVASGPKEFVARSALVFGYRSLARNQRCRDSEKFESGKLEIATVIRAHELKCQVKLFCLVSPWRLTQELIIEAQEGPEVGTT